MHALLKSLGFDVELGIATMMAAPSLPPNHGTVLVKFDRQKYLVDSGMLFCEPLLLDENKPTGIEHAAWELFSAVGKRRTVAHISWRPLHKTDGF